MQLPFPTVQIERLEARRLLAAWSMGPAWDNPTREDVSFYYHVDETGFSWEAEIGETGKPKTYEFGRRFVAEYDLTLPDHADDSGPDRGAYFAGLLERMRREYAHRQEWNPVEFLIADFGDDTFEVVACALPRPARPEPEPEPYPEGSIEGGLLEGRLIEWTWKQGELDLYAQGQAPQGEVQPMTIPSPRPINHFASSSLAIPLVALTIADDEFDLFGWERSDTPR